MSLEAVKRNGHNLELGNFKVAGAFGIPVLEPVQLNERIDWVRFNHAVQIDMKERPENGVHFFTDDYLFERAWHDPKRYVLFLSDFRAVMSPDFSTFADYPRAVQIYNHWRKHQLAAFWQRCGITVVPSISWGDRESFKWCFDGEPVGGTVAVSSVGTQKSKAARELFIDGYKEMMLRLKPGKIIFYGTVPDACEGNIEYHPPFYETFTGELAFSAKER